MSKNLIMLCRVSVDLFTKFINSVCCKCACILRYFCSHESSITKSLRLLIILYGFKFTLCTFLTLLSEEEIKGIGKNLDSEEISVELIGMSPML